MNRISIVSTCQHVNMSNGRMLASDHAAHTLVRQQLHQQRVWLPPVDDVCCRHPLTQAPDTALDFGDHAARYDSLLHQFVAFPNAQLGVNARDVVLVMQHTRHVRHQNELFRLQGRCNLPCRRIRVHIQRLSIAVGCHRRNHRDVPVSYQTPDEFRVDACDLTHKTDVLLHHLPREDRVVVLSTETNRLPARLLNQVDQGLVDPRTKHHLHDVHRLGVGHPQTILEHRLDPELSQPRIYLWTPAVHEHRLYPDGAEQRQVRYHPCL
mmetsp:Transcript_6404/g.17735  ORF Transcript_6404/g.17735 Transcript_6404/m.17735 type:complete len:266 (+) Transcript_6404:338-1135(+)